MTLTLESGTAGDQVLKVDTMGRVRRTAEQREAVLDEFEKSGMSGVKFAAHYGIKYTTFAHWLQARRRRRGKRSRRGAREAPGVSLALAEVSIDHSEKTGAPLRVELAGGVRLEITDEKGAALAAELIGSLRAR